MKGNNVSIGNSGEYFVAAELAAFDTRNMDELQQYFND